MKESSRYRFPPSPSGHLHVGNVRTALYNWLLARKSGGKFVVRIEDTDQARSSRENEERLLQDLKWLGLDWDEGPGADQPDGPYRQSERQDIYLEKVKALYDAGKAYYCFCSPQELEASRKLAFAEKRPPKYSGNCREINAQVALQRIDAGENAAVRFAVDDGPAVVWNDLVHGEKSFERGTIGDFVILRSNQMPAYNFAVVVDDALMKITHVIRGDDHISNTPRQILLYHAMGFSLPVFGHLPMILGPDGSRLSKRHEATSVEEFRQRGYLPDALINFLALLGWNPGDEREIFSRVELVDAFSCERVKRSAAIFDFEKLNWLNGQYIRTTPIETLLDNAEPFLRDLGLLHEKPIAEIKQWYCDLLELFADSCSTLRELAENSRLVFEFPTEHDRLESEAVEVLSQAGATEVLSAFLQELKSADLAVPGNFKRTVNAVKAKTGAKGKDLFHPIRIGLTGLASGPELAKLVPLLQTGSALKLPRRILSACERVEIILNITKSD